MRFVTTEPGKAVARLVDFAGPASRFQFFPGRRGADSFCELELPDHAVRGLSECLSEGAAGSGSRWAGVVSIGRARQYSDAVATSPRSANGGAQEWADFPLIPLAWSGDGPVILL